MNIVPKLNLSEDSIINAHICNHKLYIHIIAPKKLLYLQFFNLLYTK